MGQREPMVRTMQRREEYFVPRQVLVFSCFLAYWYIGNIIESILFHKNLNDKDLSSVCFCLS